MEKLDKIEVGKVSLPICVHPSVPTVLAFDNIDRQEETLRKGNINYMETPRTVWDTEAYDGELPFDLQLADTIGKLFGDAGLRDLAVEPGVIVEESINRVLDGKNSITKLCSITNGHVKR